MTVIVVIEVGSLILANWTLSYFSSELSRQISVHLLKVTFTLSIQPCGDAAFESVLLYSVSFQVSPQITCIGGCILTLAALVWFFSTVRSEMCPQIDCLCGCIVTLVAFV